MNTNDYIKLLQFAESFLTDPTNPNAPGIPIFKMDDTKQFPELRRIPRYVKCLTCGDLIHIDDVCEECAANAREHWQESQEL